MGNGFSGWDDRMDDCLGYFCVLEVGQEAF